MDRCNQTDDNVDHIDAYFYISKMLARSISIVIIGGQSPKKLARLNVRYWPKAALRNHVFLII